MLDLGAKMILEIIDKIPQQPQRQDSLASQLADLRIAANKLGLYDAADFIRKLLEDEQDGFIYKS